MHEVSVPAPAVIVPKLSDPATEGEPVPQEEIVGVVEAARMCEANVARCDASIVSAAIELVWKFSVPLAPPELM